MEKGQTKEREIVALTWSSVGLNWEGGGQKYAHFEIIILLTQQNESRKSPLIRTMYVSATLPNTKIISGRCSETAVWNALYICHSLQYKKTPDTQNIYACLLLLSEYIQFINWDMNIAHFMQNLK